MQLTLSDHDYVQIEGSQCENGITVGEASEDRGCASIEVDETTPTSAQVTSPVDVNEVTESTGTIASYELDGGKDIIDPDLLPIYVAEEISVKSTKRKKANTSFVKIRNAWEYHKFKSPERKKRKKPETSTNAADYVKLCKSREYHKLKPKPPSDISGTRIVDFRFFFEALQASNKLHKKRCNISNLLILDERRIGLESAFVFRCRSCRVVFELPLTPSKEYSVNFGAVCGSLSAGIGREKVNEVFTAMNIPAMSTSLFQYERKKLGGRAIRKTFKKSKYAPPPTPLKLNDIQTNSLFAEMLLEQTLTEGDDALELQIKDVDKEDAGCHGNAADAMEISGVEQDGGDVCADAVEVSDEEQDGGEEDVHVSRERFIRERKFPNCPRCKLPFPTQAILTSHLTTAHYQFQCLNQCGKPCDRRFSTLRRLKMHKRTVATGKKFECPRCGNGFLLKKTFAQHVRRHKPEGFVCDACNCLFMTEALLRSHSRTHKEHVCKEHCGKAFATVKLLRAHQHATGGEKPYKCSQCENSYLNKSHLKEHMRKHNNDKRFKCQYCGKAFLHRKTWDLHERVHTGRKEIHQCKTCFRSFSMKENLSKHMLTHTGERPFLCSTCGKGFISSSYLKRHLLVHSGEKLYECDLCKKHFASRWWLKRHIEMHFGDARYSCEICGKRLASKASLQNHQATHEMKAKKAERK